MSEKVKKKGAVDVDVLLVVPRDCCGVNGEDISIYFLKRFGTMVRLFAMALSTMSRHVNMCETICSMPRPLTGVRDGLTSMCQEISRMTKMLPSRVGA